LTNALEHDPPVPHIRVKHYLDGITLERRRGWLKRCSTSKDKPQRREVKVVCALRGVLYQVEAKAVRQHCALKERDHAFNTALRGQI